MRTAVTVLLGALVLAGAAQPVAAQTAADRADARCMLVLQAVGRDPKQKDAAVRGIYFYMGRMDARGGIPRLTSILLSEAASIRSPAQVQAELARCGAELAKRTAELQAVNQAIRAKARPAAPAAPST